MVKIQVDSAGKAIMLGNKALKAADGGGGEPTSRDYLVQVIDYDGTVLKSKRLREGATFTLPSAPTHEGLVFDGWSSPVTITNNTVTVVDQDITIGPMFHTASGLSEFDITLTAVTGLSVTLNMDGTKDWGDGTSDTSTTHTYSSVGDYTITCNGSTMTTSSARGLFGQSSSASAINYYVKNVRLASSVTSVGNYALHYCYSLTNITIPSSVTNIGNYAFQYCCSLTSTTIPSSVTNIGSGAFSYCYSLASITIPSSVTSIGGSAFQNCYSILEYDFSNHAAVPTLSNTTAFTNINQICKIKVPAALEAQWKAATNWSTYADYIIGV